MQIAITWNLEFYFEGGGGIKDSIHTYLEDDEILVQQQMPDYLYLPKVQALLLLFPII
jgi:hypothetical protein